MNNLPPDQCVLRDGAKHPVILPDGKVAVFWRAKCLLTGREERRRSHLTALPTFEQMRVWVNESFRNLELLEVRPWDAVEDAHRIVHPVPVQHINFYVKKPDLERPEPRRSLLVSQRTSRTPRSPRKSLFLGE